MNKRVTIKDIASHLGVHVSTVSRALSPGKNGNISSEAIEKVRAAANEWGYRPNRLAAGLRTRKSMTIGIVIPDISNVLFPPMVRGIESVLEPLGYASILVNTDSDAEREARLIEVLRDRGVDGIIHAAVLRDDPTIAQAYSDGVPVVTLNRKIDGSAIPYVINEEAEGIRLAVRHLLELGHHNIAHLAGPQNLSTGQLRLEAFKQAMADFKLPDPPELITDTARFDEQEGRSGTRRLLSAGTKFTAIVCANDRLALGAISMLRSAGLSCPKDISVTGFNDMPFLDMIDPALTTVRIQQSEAGIAVAQRLIASIEKQDGCPVETILPVSLVVRESTGKIPGASTRLHHA